MYETKMPFDPLNQTNAGAGPVPAPGASGAVPPFSGARSFYSVPPRPFEKSDLLLALLLPVPAFLWVRWIFSAPSPGLGAALFIFIFCALSLFYLRKRTAASVRAGLPYLLFLLAGGLSFVLFDLPRTGKLHLPVLSAAAVYWVAAVSGRRLENRLSSYGIFDLLNHLFRIPFSNFSCLPAGIREALFRRKGGRSCGIFAAVLGLLAFAPVFGLILWLLIRADANFEWFFRNIRFTFRQDWATTFLQLLLSVPVSFYLYGLLYGNASGRYLDRFTLEEAQKTAASFRLIPPPAVLAALASLCLLYLLFCFSQASYLLSAFRQILPEAMTYSQYARRGFFELCAVAAINLAVLGGARLLIRRADLRSLRAFTGILSGLTLLLIAAALCKMILYIRSYGLTPLRVYPTWFMLLLFVLFLLILLRQIRPFPAAKAMTASVLIFCLILAYADVDRQIAAYNLGRIGQGTLREADWESFHQLSAGAAEPLYRAYLKSEDPREKQQIAQAIFQIRENRENSVLPPYALAGFNRQQYRLARITEALEKELQ